jgi:sirohydrochlorin ferrochelatase
MKTAVVLLGHGSREPAARQYFLDLAEAVAEPSGSEIVEPAFLELCGPSFAETMATCAAHGAERVVVVPVFLHPGRHVVRDVPRLVDEARAAYPRMEVLLAASLGDHPELRPLVTDLVRRALAASTAPTPEPA